MDGNELAETIHAQAGPPLYDGQPDYGGGIGFDPQNPNVVYMATDAANPFDLSTTTNVPLGPHYELWRGVTADGGLTFNWQAITRNPSWTTCASTFPGATAESLASCGSAGLTPVTLRSVPKSSACSPPAFRKPIPPAERGAPTRTAWSDTTKWQNAIVGSGAGNIA